jgi:hypothetical protein
LRGRKTVRAQSAILYKTLKSCLVLTITEFLRGCAFHPRKNSVGARSAQVLAKPARTKNRPRGSPLARG